MPYSKRDTETDLFDGAANAVADRGYALCRHVIPPVRLTTVAKALERLDEPDGVSTRRGAVYGARGLLAQPAIAALAGSDPLSALARAVLGTSARPVKATLFDKRPGANWQVGWHQDLTVAVRERRDVPGFSNWTTKAGVAHTEAPDDVLARMVALRLHIDDCAPNNGPLAVIPGSHCRGKLCPADREALIGSTTPDICMAAAGDVLAMRPLILHRSSPARSPSRRRVLHVEYASADLPGGLCWQA